MQLIDKQSTINLLRLNILMRKSNSEFYLYTDDNSPDDIARLKAKITELNDLYRLIPAILDELEVIYDTNKID